MIQQVLQNQQQMQQSLAKAQALETEVVILKQQLAATPGTSSFDPTALANAVTKAVLEAIKGKDEHKGGKPLAESNRASQLTKCKGSVGEPGFKKWRRQIEQLKSVMGPTCSKWPEKTTGPPGKNVFKP